MSCLSFFSVRLRAGFLCYSYLFIVPFSALLRVAKNEPGMGRLVSPSRAVREKNCCMIQLPTMNPFGYFSFLSLSLSLFWSLGVRVRMCVCTEDLPLLFRLCDARSQMRPRDAAELTDSMLDACTPYCTVRSEAALVPGTRSVCFTAFWSLSFKIGSPGSCMANSTCSRSEYIFPTG
ncbi:hypothetical protein J3F84DRAFT_360116 [Trichoderma pleuroticola]